MEFICTTRVDEFIAEVFTNTDRLSYGSIRVTRVDTLFVEVSRGIDNLLWSAGLGYQASVMD